MAGIYNASAKGSGAKPGKINNAVLPAISTLIQAGIDPKTGLPLKAVDVAGGIGFKENNKRLLKVMDEQDAINRFTWYNLPDSLTGQLLERIIYYRGQGAFFYMESADKFFFLPYSLNGTIDVYGRFTDITPLPFNGAIGDSDKDKPWIKGLSRKCIYDIISEEDIKLDDFLNDCVILKDYTPQESETIISRSVLNDPLLDVMADCLPFMHTALLNSTGIVGMRVGGEDEQSNVLAASNSLTRAALTGKKFVPIIAPIEFQELTGGEVAKSEEFLLALQAMDNYRLSLYGLDNGGLFQKKAHMLEAEQNMNAGKASLAMQDCLTLRQNFCDVINSIWRLGVWCEISETALGIDRNMDGEIDENEPQTKSYMSEGDTGDDNSVG